MKELTSLASTDGNVLLFNLNLSSHPNAKEIKFPNSKDSLPDDYARMLFDGSSILTPFMLTLAKEEGLQVADGAKAFVLNSSLEILIKALEIGTRPSNLR